MTATVGARNASTVVVRLRCWIGGCSKGLVDKYLVLGVWRFCGGGLRYLVRQFMSY